MTCREFLGGYYRYISNFLLQYGHILALKGMAFPQFGHIRSGSADFVEVEIGISSPDVILL